VYIHGTKLDNRLIWSSELKFLKNRNYTKIVAGATSNQRGDWTIRKFKFSTLQTSKYRRKYLTLTVSTKTDTADDSKPDSAMLEKTKEIGQISVIFQRVKNVYLDEDQSMLYKHEEPSVIPEKALKGRAISQRTQYTSPQDRTAEELILYSLGTAEKASAAAIYHADYVDQQDAPLANFHFLYRPKRKLIHRNTD